MSSAAANFDSAAYKRRTLSPEGRQVTQKKRFDIGMYDGSDSRYFLDEGYHVVAVEANPELAAKAMQ